MAHNVDIGNAAQGGATQHGIITGDNPPVSALLDFTIPELAPDGTRLIYGMVLMIVVVRNQAAECSDASWTLTHSVGASGVFLDVYERVIDGTVGSRPGDIVSIFSFVAQELEGGMLFMQNTTAGSAVERIANGAFIADANPAAPIVSSDQAENTLLVIWSAAGSIAFTPPAGLTTVDAYSSGTFSTRSILIGKSIPGEIGDVDPGAAVAAPAASGRAFSLILHWVAPAVAGAELVTARPSKLAGFLDQYLDPITLDYVDTDDGEWLETPDSRTLVMIMIDMRLGRSYSAPTDGTRIAELLEQGDPVTPAIVVSEVTRAMTALAISGVLSNFSIRTTETDGSLLVDESGRFSPELSWIDLATGSPIDLVYTPFQR